MRGVAFWFFFTGTLYVLAGMLFGIQMSMIQNFQLAPAHAHLNLLGWVTMALFGLYYHNVPRAAESRLSWVHFWLATIAVWVFVPGIVLAEKQITEALAIVGSLLVLLQMALFAYVVATTRAAAA